MSESIIKRLEIYSKETGNSYSKIAKMIGIGPSTISEIRKGSYQGDVKEMLYRIDSFLGRHQKGMRRIDFVAETEVYKKIFFAIDTVKRYVASNAENEILSSAKIAYIIGRAGIGKTYALQEYKRIYGARIIFITAETGITGNVLLRRIARELKLEHTGRIESLKESIKKTLKFTETIIIVDESEHMPPRVIDILRSIGDQTGIGLVLTGTEELRKQVTSGGKNYEYLYSRAVVWMTLNELNIKDIDKIVRKFIRSDIDYYNEAQISSMVSYVNKTVRGSARKMENLLVMASAIANDRENIGNSSGMITLDYLKAAANLIATF